MTKKRVMAMLLVSAMMGTMMTSLTVQADERPFEGQEITFADTGAGDWEEVLEPIIAKFEEETGAKVNMELYAHADYLELL